MIFLKLRVRYVVQPIYDKKWLNPPQIATQCFLFSFVDRKE